MTLTDLLAQRLPRGMRCDRCAHWHPDGDGCGDCDEQDARPSTSAHEGCVYWSPAPGCGLDYRGVPLASPLAEED